MIPGPVCGEYDLLIFDLDGVLYLGEQAVAGAPEAVGRLAESSKSLLYVTNNASRSAEAVAALLRSLGIPAGEREIVTSGWVTAQLLADRYAPGSPVLVVGSAALEDEIALVGLRPVRTAEVKPVAVAQGYGPDVGWAALAEATLAIRAGAEWIATNTDRTLPSPRGPLPGNGALVGAVSIAIGRPPDTVVGKPDPILFEKATRSRQAGRPLVIGDRLDTDIEGARRAGMDSLLVLTGVSTPTDVFAAPPSRRPTLLAENLDGLFAIRESLAFDRAAGSTPGAARGDGRIAACSGGWRVRTDGSVWFLAGEGRPIDALRLLCACRWAADAEASAGTPRTVVGEGASAKSALRDLGLG